MRRPNRFGRKEFDRTWHLPYSTACSSISSFARVARSNVTARTPIPQVVVCGRVFCDDREVASWNGQHCLTLQLGCCLLLGRRSLHGCVESSSTLYFDAFSAESEFRIGFGLLRIILSVNSILDG